MRPRHIVSVIHLSFLTIAVIACNAQPPTPRPTTLLPATPTDAAPPTLTVVPPTQPPTVVVTKPTQKAVTEKEYEDFDASRFVQPTSITNEWFPIKPGMQYIYEGLTDKDGKPVPHRFVINVTDLTKTIGGVRSIVSWDQDFADDQLVEAELAFYAQDQDGAVWLMGEYPEEYEGGVFTRAPAWIHGFEDARAGIAMQAKPRTETPSYSQGWGPAVGWTDRGQVRLFETQVCPPVQCYDNVLVIAESSKAEPNAYQLKYFAKGVGNVRVDWLGADVTHERLDLVKMTQLSPEQMAEVRKEALALERHAYETGNTAYAKTTPLEDIAGQPVQTTPTESSKVSDPPSHAVAPELLNIEVQIEDIMDVLPEGNWDAANADIVKVDSEWTNYRKQVIKDGATQSVIDAFDQLLAQLKTAAESKAVTQTMQSANDLSAVVVDLYDVYRPSAPTDLGRLDVFERQIILDINKKDFAAAEKTLAKIDSVWLRVKPVLLTRNIVEIAAQYEKSLDRQRASLKAQDAKATQQEAMNALEILDALDRAVS
jgi:hypothetical protein